MAAKKLSVEEQVSQGIQPPAPEMGDPDPSTPSGHALKKVGAPKEGASDEALLEHAARYEAAKKEKRWG